MWKYRNTNEMYTNMSAHIYHSDVYLGEDFSDGIKHFKYIKKERKNGRWVYYYDGSLNSDRNMYRDDLKYNIKNGFVSKTTKRGYSQVGLDGKTYDYHHYRKAFASDYLEWKKLDAKIAAAKITAKTLNAVSSGISKGKKLLSKIFGWRL